METLKNQKLQQAEELLKKAKEYLKLSNQRDLPRLLADFALQHSGKEKEPCAGNMCQCEEPLQFYEHDLHCSICQKKLTEEFLQHSGEQPEGEAESIN